MEAYAYESPTRTTNYGFTLQDPQDPPTRAVAIGEAIDGNLDRVGQRHRMTL